MTPLAEITFHRKTPYDSPLENLYTDCCSVPRYHGLRLFLSGGLTRPMPGNRTIFEKVYKVWACQVTVYQNNRRPILHVQLTSHGL